MPLRNRLAELGIELPAVAAPVAAYIPARQVGSQIRTSGQLPFVDGELAVRGKVGDTVSAEQAYAQARIAALNALAAAASIREDFTITHVTVFVASAPDFTAQPQVANGASDLFAEVFGADGAHTRSAVGVAVLPLDSPVEVELVCQAGVVQ